MKRFLIPIFTVPTRRLLIIPVLFLTLMVGNPAWGEWTKVSESVKGNTHYVDFERIRKQDGSVYFWEVLNFLKPLGAFLSVKKYKQIDCKIFRFKELRWFFHRKPMGRGTGENLASPPEKWDYPPPGSSNELVLKSVCDYVKNR
jgi:hypothetical protein